MDLAECSGARPLSCAREVWIQRGWRVVSLARLVDQTEASIDHATDVATSAEKTANAFAINAFSLFDNAEPASCCCHNDCVSNYAAVDCGQLKVLEHPVVPEHAVLVVVSCCGKSD